MFYVCVSFTNKCAHRMVENRVNARRSHIVQIKQEPTYFLHDLLQTTHQLLIKCILKHFTKIGDQSEILLVNLCTYIVTK